MEDGPECRGTYGRWARMQGHLWKVGPSAGELMEGGPKCRGTYGRWARMLGNLWKVGQSAGELMDGGHEFRQSLRPKMPKNGIWQLFIYIFGCFIFISIFFLNIFENDFRIKDAYRSDGHFATKIGALVCMVGKFEAKYGIFKVSFAFFYFF